MDNMDKLIDVGRMDNYYEQIVKKHFTPVKKAALALSLTGIVLVIFISVYLSGFFGWLVPVSLMFLGLGGWLIYYIIKNSGVEYEYTFVLGEMRVERIKGKTRRKKVTAFDVKAIDDIDIYINPETGERNVDPKKFDLVLRAAANELDGQTYYAQIHDKVRHKPALILFTPNEMTLEKIKPYLSVELKKKFFLSQKKLKGTKAEKAGAKPEESSEE